MKFEKTCEIPARKETILDYIQCDLCGAKSDYIGNWGKEKFTIRQVKVSMTTGENFYEVGSSTEKILDICPECFESKLILWFQGNGGKVREQERDW